MLTRKQFLHSALGIGAATLGLTVLTGCDTDAQQLPDASGSASCLEVGTRVMISANHGHVLVVTKEDVAALADKTYDIRGSSSHSHTVAVTREMFQQLTDNHAVMVTSSVDDDHSHDVMIACA